MARPRPRLPDHRDDGYDDDPYDGAAHGGGDGGWSDAVAPGAHHSGGGGRLLAVGGLLFLVVSVAIASVGGVFSRGGGRGADDTPTSVALAAIASPDGSGDGDGPLVSWDDQPLPTMTLPPAGVVEQGYAGPWLDGVRTICIDPGHGGPDRGRTFAGDGNIPPLEEATFTLAQAEALHDLLADRGYVVVMTRTADQAVNADDADTNGDGKTAADSDRDGVYDEIQARIDVCNRANADLMISVHINGYDTGVPSGYESWYTGARPFGDQSAVFAQLGVDALGKRMAAVGYEPEARGAKDDGTYSVDDSDPMLAHNMLLTGPELPGELTPSQMPGAIMECAFITNLDDAAFLLSADSEAIVAGAYADAIDGYFERFQS